jgi:S-ribosylhomocysteine lyase LuxS involved in autoinducer biosynthesis
MVLAFNFMANSKNHNKRNGIVHPSPMGKQKKVDLAIIATPKKKDTANEKKQRSK